MGGAATGIFAVLLLSSTLALPSRRLRGDPAAAASNFVGEGTNELATAILQGYVDLDSNLAFSPFGYAALLAILAEGARGSTRDQLVNALRLPEDPQVTRTAYKTILQRFNEKDSLNHPEFRNWFYVYRNFTVEPDYKTILQNNYLTEVRDVDRLDRDAVRKEAASMKVPESAQIAGDVLVQEENINEMKPNKSEDSVKVDDSVVPEKSADGSMAPGKLEDESITPEKFEDSSVSAKTEETMVSDKTDDGDKIPEKIGTQMPSAESEEIMQVSDGEDGTKPNKNGPLKVVLPIPFPEKLKLRKMFDEREASPSGAVMTMQEEMLGNKKEEEKANSENKDEKMKEMKDDIIEAEKKDKIKETGSMNEKMEIPSDDRKEEKNEEVKAEIKNDQIKDDGNMEVMKQEKNDKTEAIKYDKTEATKVDKMDAMIGDKKGATQDGNKELIQGDKMVALKDDRMEAMKDDKVEAMKDKEMEAMKSDNTEAMKEEVVTDEKKGSDKKGSMTEAITDEVTKDETKTEDKDMKNEDMITGVMMKEEIKVDPMKEKGATLSTGRKARHLVLHRLSRVHLQSDDVTSSISGNNIVRKGTKSEVLVFNGLYFRGTWATPFARQKEESFYRSDNEKITVTTMSTEGIFRAGNVPELDSVAIELPYKGGRYSLLVLIPNSRTGLNRLTSDLAGYSLRNVDEQLQLQEVEVSLPNFDIQTTTKPIEALNKFGVSDIFSKEKADLSGISKDSGLFVEELVQLVTVKVDSGSSSYNHITAGNPSTRSGLFKVAADHPFLYFVRDTEDNLVVVAGKVTDPSHLN